MPQWTAFAGVTAAVLVLLLALARASQRLVSEQAGSGVSGEGEGTTHQEGIADGREPARGTAGPGGPPSDATGVGVDGDPRTSACGAPSPRRVGSASTDALLANVAVSQALFGGILVAAAWYMEIPGGALGLAVETGWLVAGIGIGIPFGLGLYLANELGAAVVDAAGIDYSEELRELLAPDSPAGWVLLLVGVLPVVATVEEFLFRGALVGAISAGFAISPWVLAIASSIAFALGHGAQGGAGIVVTGVLGFALAAGFVLTGSLLVVIVAHYLVNALEFGVHEGLGFEWF